MCGVDFVFVITVSLLFKMYQSICYIITSLNVIFCSKSKAYINKPVTMYDLKQNIRNINKKKICRIKYSNLCDVAF